jgi:RimJ/RimL family protein N-acetyltransferase
MIRLEEFNSSAYDTLISWVESEEALMQFAGPGLSFPLTPAQLDDSLNDENRWAFKVIPENTQMMVGYGEVYLTDHAACLGRILVGDKDLRGKGIGTEIVRHLVQFAFRELGKTRAELNVFDWNTNAIKCYERVGFSVNKDKRFERKIKGETWIALNMVLERSRWEQWMA